MQSEAISGHQRTVDRPQSEAIICNHMQSEAISGHQRTVDRPHEKARGKAPRTSQHLTAYLAREQRRRGEHLHAGAVSDRFVTVSSLLAARRSGGGAQHGARLREARARGVDDLIDAEVESHGRLGMLALGDAIGAQQLGGVVLAVRD